MSPNRFLVYKNYKMEYYSAREKRIKLPFRNEKAFWKRCLTMYHCQVCNFKFVVILLPVS